ncbi:MAG: protoporphyrinogen oxidase [Ardenticatenaceae bacterium]|nr:protoporphyrinogen oxidase [Ardenticatenaceae bacterium]MCB9444892.1 protoporphyrinogen oxidase [Ardenticatenaceae bacterium]
MVEKRQKIVIIGGGVSGLATTYYMEKLAQELDLSIHCTVIESTPVLGGKISTDHSGGFITEGGPESFVTRKRQAWELCQELGLGNRLVGTTERGKNYILHNGRPQIVPMGPVDAIRTPLLSFRGKLRVLREPFVAPRTDLSDETLGDFLRRRVGGEIVENVVAPAMGSVYLSDVNQVSTQVVFGQFADMEREHGSLVKGMFALMKQRKAERQLAEQNGQSVKKEKLPAFMTLRDGLIELIETLADKIEGDILLDSKVVDIAYTPVRLEPYQLSLIDGQVISTDLVILAIPTFAMADLLEDFDTAVARNLRAVHYNPVATISVAYNKGDIPEPFDGFGVVVPESESSKLLAIEAVSNKFGHRSPTDQAVLRAFIGGYRHEDLIDLPDDELSALVQEELASIFNIQAAPTFIRIFRWQPANPQYGVGHLAMVTEVERKLQKQLPGLYLTGSGMRGMGIPDCVRQARKTANQIIEALQQAHAAA